jgi:hypothetical protein
MQAFFAGFVSGLVVGSALVIFAAIWPMLAA